MAKTASCAVSQHGLELIKAFEGFRPAAYLCPAGKLTIGYGHVIQPVDCLRPGQTITRIRAEALLHLDCRLAEIYISAIFPVVTPGQPAPAGQVTLTQTEFDALVCFAYNVGLGALENSTLLKKLRVGDKAGAADEFLRWDKITNPSSGVKEFSKGLHRRRAMERELFLGGAK